ncbi:MAG: hypothetical protein R2722_12530 [Tessaracoccus sp.]
MVTAGCSGLVSCTGGLSARVIVAMMKPRASAKAVITTNVLGVARRRGFVGRAASSASNSSPNGG